LEAADCKREEAKHEMDRLYTAIHGEGVKGSSPPSLIPSFQGFFVNA
jgi:hypothetical protein